jgi:hypothetical protein
MEYGVWNRDYDLHKNGVDHLVAKRRLIHPRRQEKKITHTKGQPSKQIALQIDSPPNIEKQDVKRKKKSREQSLYASHTKHDR